MNREKLTKNLRSWQQWVWGIILEGCLFVVMYYYVTHYTLVSPSACILMRDEEVVEQPVQLTNLTVRFTHEALHFIDRFGPSK